MRAVKIKEARERLRKLLDAVIAGEEVVICRRDKPVAKLVRITEKPAFSDRREFRNRIGQAKTPAAKVIRELREERG